MYSSALCLFVLSGTSGLRTVRKIQLEYDAENFVLYDLTNNQRSLHAELRPGVLVLVVHKWRTCEAGRRKLSCFYSPFYVELHHF